LTERRKTPPQAATEHPTPTGVDELAEAAVADIRGGMIVGLGTGRTANRAIRALARRVQQDRLDIDCVCSSTATRELCEELLLPIVPFDDVESIDYAFDGADEVDARLRMLKGHQGALTRQRLVAAVSNRNVYLAQEDKIVDHLGQKAPLAVTIIPFGITSTRNRLRDMGLCGVLRHTLGGDVFVTEGGGVVLDMRLPENCDIEKLALQLDHVPGIVDHGLFLTEADEVLVEGRHGGIRRLLPPE
jgi:ribose 5-phosphate isomerase A